MYLKFQDNRFLNLKRVVDAVFSGEGDRLRAEVWVDRNTDSSGPQYTIEGRDAEALLSALEMECVPTAFTGGAPR